MTKGVFDVSNTCKVDPEWISMFNLVLAAKVTKVVGEKTQSFEGVAGIVIATFVLVAPSIRDGKVSSRC